MDFLKYDWRLIMDWVVIASCFAVVVTLVVDIIKSVKDKNSLSEEHKGLSKENDRLEKGHDKLETTIKEKYSEIAKVDASINDKVNVIYTETQKQAIQFSNLTEAQKDAKKQMESFQFLMKEVARLQAENNELKEQLQFKNMQQNQKPKGNNLYNDNTKFR